MNIKIDEELREILNVFKKNKYEVYIVGGAVRDFIIGRKVKDWDLATNALPDKVVEIFLKTQFKTIDISKKHGTIIIKNKESEYEVTTFRIENEYIDNRRPKEVVFTEDLHKDLLRRDFTMNALAYSINDGIIDIFDGINDIKNNVIRCVGNPNKRFNEDALRMLRAIRFSNQLDFIIEKNTLNAIKDNYKLVNNLSKERIREEFNKILLSEKPSRGIKLLKKLKLLDLIIPEIKVCYDFDQHNPNHNLDVFKHTLKVLDNIESDLVLRLAALFHDIGKPKTFFIGDDKIGHFYNHHEVSVEITKNVLKRLKYSNIIIKKVLELIKEHMVVYNEEFSDKAVKKLLKRVDSVGINNLIKLQLADIKATANPKKYQHLDKLKSRCKKIFNNNEPLSIKDIDINGYDLMDLGISEGKIIGNILNELLELVLEEPSFNNKEKLIDIVKKTWKS